MGFYFPFKACWKKGTNVFWKLELLPCWFWSQQKIEQVSGCFFLTGISDKFNFERRYSWYTVGKNSNNKSSIMNVNLRVTIYRPSFDKNWSNQCRKLSWTFRVFLIYLLFSCRKWNKKSDFSFYLSRSDVTKQNTINAKWPVWQLGHTLTGSIEMC